MADDETPADAPASVNVAAEKPVSTEATPIDLAPPDVTADDTPSAQELRRANLDRLLVEISAKAAQAKRQNMLDNLADAVIDLAALLRLSLIP